MAQAVAALGLCRDCLDLLRETDVVLPLLQVLEPSEINNQAEPQRDEYYAVLALNVLAMKTDWLDGNENVIRTLRKVANDGLVKKTRQAAQLGLEALCVAAAGAPLGHTCRMEIRRQYQRNFKEYRAFVEKQSFAESVKSFLLYNMED